MKLLQEYKGQKKPCLCYSLTGWQQIAFQHRLYVTYHGLGIYLKPHFDQVCKVPLNCSKIPGLYRIICTKEEPGSKGRKMCTLLQCINNQLKFMAGNSKQWGYMQISHSKPSCMSSLFIDVFLLNAMN